MGLKAAIERRRIVRPCEACGSESDDPATHKTWCSVRILAAHLHPPKDLTGRAA